MPPSRNRMPVGLLVLATYIGCIVALMTLQTKPRFEYPPLNHAAVIALALALPAILFWLGSSVLPRGWGCAAKVVASLIFIPISMFAIFMLCGLFDMVAYGFDPSFERIAEIKGEHAYHRLYRTNGGATTAFGLVLRKEVPLPLGLKLVTWVRSYYPACDARLERLPSGRARLRVEHHAADGKDELFEFSP